MLAKCLWLSEPQALGLKLWGLKLLGAQAIARLRGQDMINSEGASGSDPEGRSRLSAALTADAVPRRIAVTLAIVLLYRMGSLLPAPGINPQVVFGGDAAALSVWSMISSRLSYFALQLTPLFSMLLIAEVFKLAFSDVRNWVNESARTRYLFNKILLVAALLLAALQAYGIAVGLEAVQDSMSATGTPLIVEPGAAFRSTHIAGLVAGTALAIWLADQITRYGVGSGFWILFLSPSLIALASAPSALASHVATRDVRLEAIIALVALLCATAAAIVVLARQWRELAHSDNPNADDVGRTSNVMSILIWPAFIAASVLGLIAVCTNFLTSLDDGSSAGRWLQSGSIGSGLWLAALIILLTYMMANAVLTFATRAMPTTQRLIALTALTASVACVGIDVLVSQFVPISLAGPTWIAIVAVLTLILPINLSRFIPASAVQPPPSDSDFSAT